MSRRSPESYQWHLDHVVAACGTKWLVLETPSIFGPEYILTVSLCHSNYCNYCRSFNLRKLRQSLYQSLHHKQWRLVTLTYPDHSLDKLQTLTNIAKQFKRFIQRLRRRYPHLAFVRTIELHESDFPHIHLIIDRYVPKALIAKHWHDLGGGIVDIHATAKCEVCGARGKCEHNPHPQRLSYKKAADYLTEELIKKNQDPHKLGLVYWLARVRSITLSRNLKLSPPSHEWKFCAIFEEFSHACNYITSYNEVRPYTEQQTLEPHDMKNAIFYGYGLKQHRA
jgi:hypothetical protein